MQIGATKPLKAGVAQLGGGQSELGGESEQEVNGASQQMRILEALRETDFGAPSHSPAQSAKDLVQHVASSVTLSLPQLSIEEMQHAVFIKQLFHEGEICFTEFIRKMENRFPERMGELSDALRIAVEMALAE